MSTLGGTPGGSGRYRFERRIATGGMGEVWAATDQVLGREVAIKLLKPEYADDAMFRSRFETEARNAAALHHANVASVFDFGELPEGDGGHGRPFLVMELVRGEPLSALLRSDRRMHADTAANLLAQAADGLAAAHRLGIVHRDVKPANLLVTPDRTLKITDFGIARAADAVPLTQTGQVIGTPQYFSPEQAQGRPATPASDIYSLGVVLYECLAGKRPFDADSPVATALAHLRDPPPPLPDDVPDQLRRTVEVALAKDPASRFAAVSDMATALRGGELPATTATQPAVPPVTQGSDQAATRVVPATGRTTRPRTDPTAGSTRVVPAVGDDHQTSRAMGPTPTGPLAPVPSGGGTGRAALVTVVVVVVVLLAVVLAFLVLNNRQKDQAQGPATSPSPSATSSSPSAASPTVTARVKVDAKKYLGLKADEARRELKALGLVVAPYSRVDNTGDHEAGTVAGVSPTGSVDVGSTVTLLVYKAPASASPTPSQTPTPSGTSTPSPSQTASPSDGTTPSSSGSATDGGDQ